MCSVYVDSILVVVWADENTPVMKLWCHSWSEVLDRIELGSAVSIHTYNTGLRRGRVQVDLTVGA